MAKGQLQRIQPDLIKEIEDYPGGSFSEKMRNWKKNGDGGCLELDDLDDVVREVVREELESLTKRI